MAAEVVTLILLALAVYRLTRLITADMFPPIAALRAWPARRFGEESSWAYLAECPWCVSMYVATALVVGVDLLATVSVPLPVLAPLACSAVTGFLARLGED